MKYKDYNAEWIPTYFFSGDIDDKDATNLFETTKEYVVCLMIDELKNSIYKCCVVKTDEAITFNVYDDLYVLKSIVKDLPYNNKPFVFAPPSHMSYDQNKVPTPKVKEKSDVLDQDLKGMHLRTIGKPLYDKWYVQVMLIRQYEITQGYSTRLIYALDRIHYLSTHINKNSKYKTKYEIINHISDQSGYPYDYLDRHIRSRNGCLSNWKAELGKINNV